MKEILHDSHAGLRRSSMFGLLIISKENTQK